MIINLPFLIVVILSFICGITTAFIIIGYILTNEDDEF